MGTIDEDGSFDVVDHLPMSGGWWWSLLSVCLAPGWSIPPISSEQELAGGCY